MKRLFFLFILTTYTIPLLGQAPDPALISEAFSEILNRHRESKGLVALQADTLLERAAIDHARYLASLGRLTHEQFISGKRTPAERVDFYGGIYGEVGENIGVTDWREKNHEGVAKAFFELWKNSPAHYKHMINPGFRTSGLGFVADRTGKQMYGVQVFGGDRFVPTPGLDFSNKAYELKSYTAGACRRVAENAHLAAGLPLFLRRSASSIYLYFHDREVLKQIISEPGDGLAVDIIERRQLACERPNTFHPDPVFDGYLLAPVGPTQLYSNSQTAGTYELVAYLGEIPEVLADKDIQFNLITINAQTACANSFFVDVPFDQLPLFRINPVWAFEQLAEVRPLAVPAVTAPTDEPKPTVLSETFSLRFPKGSTVFPVEQWEKVRRFLPSRLAELDSVSILAYSSVEGKTEINTRLQKERAEEIRLALIELGVPGNLIQAQALENWPLFYRQVIGTQWERFTGMDRQAVKAELAKPLVEEALQQQLADQREAEVVIHYTKVLSEAFGPYQISKTGTTQQNLLRQVQAAINSQQAEKALELQENLVRSFLQKEVRLQDFLALEIAAKKENIALLSNQLALELFFKDFVRTDDEFVEHIQALKKLAPTYYPLLFNYCGYAVRYLYQRGTPLLEPEALEQMIYDLYEREDFEVAYQDLESTLDRLMINHHLASVDYFFKTRQYNQRGRALTAIRDYFSDQEMSEAEALQLALFFNRNFNFEWSIDLLNPYLQRPEASDELLFTYVETYSLLGEEVRNDAFYRLLRICLQRDPTRLCEWMEENFQLMRDAEIKEIFCGQCP